MDTWVDIGVLGEEQGEEKVPEILYLEKHKVTEHDGTYRVVVSKRPVSVGIDPLNKLIDRNPADNVSVIPAS
jgi:ABC-2 type transport system permease protein